MGTKYMTFYCAVILSLLFLKTRACVTECSAAGPIKLFNVCGADCGLWIDCTNASNPIFHNCTGALSQFDENIRQCVVVSHTCPNATGTNINENPQDHQGIQQDNSTELETTEPNTNPLFTPSPVYPSTLIPPTCVIVQFAITSLQPEEIATQWYRNSRPRVETYCTSVTVPYSLKCARMCQADPLCLAFALEEDQFPIEVQCFFYYVGPMDQSALIYDEYMTTYIFRK